MSFLITQALISGLTNGLVYALIGMGMAAIFKGSRIINAMQGEFCIVGGIVAVMFTTRLGLPLWLGLIAGILSGAVLGFLIEILFVRHMVRKNASEDSFLLLTIGLAMTLSAGILYFVGRDSFMLQAIGGDDVMMIGEGIIRTHALWLIGISLAITFGLRLFYRHSALGLSMMAASIDPDGATTVGIDVARMRAYTFALGGVLGAVGGILVSPLVPVSYQLGLALTLKGFAAAILGGLTNPLGAVVGGVTLGLIEALAIISVSSGYKDVAAFSVLILIMVIMPQGMLGRKSRVGG